ncbi:hypothetical protein AB0O58_15370 [Rhodococcus sp. NPDC080181]
MVVEREFVRWMECSKQFNTLPSRGAALAVSGAMGTRRNEEGLIRARDA